MGALGNSAELEAELIKRNRDIAKVHGGFFTGSMSGER